MSLITYKYASASIALDELKEKGFEIDFNVEENLILKNPEDFKILVVYRYEGNSNPDDESTVYGIERISNGNKGVFVVGDLAFTEGDVAKILIDLEAKSK